MATRRRLLLTVVITMTTAGCGSAFSAGEPEPLAGRTFLSVPAEPGEGGMRLVEGTRVRLSFEKGTVKAQAGCNLLRGDVAADGDRLVVSEVGTTLIGCSPELTDQDTRLSRFLQDGPRWQVDGDTLLLTTHETRLRLVDIRSIEPDRPLEGSRWALETIQENGTAGSVPAGANAYLTIGAGRVTGATNCTQFEGSASVAGSTVTFGGLTTRKVPCAAHIKRWDSAILDLLRGAVTVRITGDRLTLTGAGGRALQFRAES